jgi:hypothetical protein
MTNIVKYQNYNIQDCLRRTACLIYIPRVEG